MTPERWARVRAVFESALGLQGVERAEYLRGACHDDASLQSEVASLISAHQRADSFMEQPPSIGGGAQIRTGDVLAKRYQILSLIAAGGMGAVYEAEDLEIHERLALKVIHPAWASATSSIDRFKRELQLARRVTHPNVCRMFDLGVHRTPESDPGCPDILFLTMELVSGETLAGKLRRGPLPIPTALTVCAQIAAALEDAHDKGVIHRDLKPANVKITDEGRPKVLDFGLAKSYSEATSGESGRTTSATDALTTGLILGTAAYMSPEQARGQALDRRTDIWSFGCVLYETLSGRRAFPGNTPSDAIASVLGHEPEWLALPTGTPPRVRDLLRRCLQKDRDRRLRDIGDARLEIEDAGLSSSAFLPGSPSTKGPQRQWRFPLAWMAAGTLLGVVSTVALARRALPARPHLPFRLSVNNPSAARLLELGLAFAPDGTQLAYVAESDHQTRIYLRAMEQVESTPVPGTEGGHRPFFSPDGRWLGFEADGKLKKVLIAGGTPITLCAAPELRGASWGLDGTILFAPSQTGGLSQVSAAGGQVQVVTRTTASEGQGSSHRWPTILPGGKWALFNTTKAGEREDDRTVALLSLESGQWTSLVTGGSYPRYARTGHIVYARAGSLHALPFDLKALRATGPSVPVLDNVRMDANGTASAEFDVSATGSLAFVPGLRVRERELVWVDRKGEETPLTASRRAFRFPRFSPDGTRLAIGVEAPSKDIWVYDLTRDSWARLTFEGDNECPIWSPDGRRLAFSSNRAGPWNVFSTSADGGGSVEQLTKAQWAYGLGFSPDGAHFAFAEHKPTTGYDISLLALGGTLSPASLLATPFREFAARYSPDGRWVAYDSDESGRREVYVRSTFTPVQKTLISIGGGDGPEWNPAGSELFYRNGARLMAVALRVTDRLIAGKPRLVFERDGSELDLAVFPDGQRFAMVKDPGKPARTAQIVVAPNWSAELEARPGSRDNR